MSRPSEPVDIVSMSPAVSCEPSFMIEPLPKARSICPSAASKARCLSIASLSKRRNAACIPRPSFISQPAATFNASRREANVLGLFGHAIKKFTAHRSFANYLFNLNGELLQAERLRQKMNVAVATEPLTERILGIAGNENDLDVGIDPANFADQLRSVHLRHHYVGDQQIDPSAPCRTRSRAVSPLFASITR